MFDEVTLGRLSRRAGRGIAPIDDAQEKSSAAVSGGRGRRYKEFMAVFDRAPENRHCHGGTFSANPVTCARAWPPWNCSRKRIRGSSAIKRGALSIDKARSTAPGGTVGLGSLLIICRHQSAIPLSLADGRR